MASPVQRTESITSLIWLATLFLIQASMPGHTLAHLQLLLTNTARSLFSGLLSSHSSPLPVVVVTQVQDPAIHLTESHIIGLELLPIQPVQVPLQSLTALQQINTPNTTLCLLRVHSIPSSGSSVKILNRTGPNTEPCGTSPGPGCQLDAALSYLALDTRYKLPQSAKSQRGKG